LNNTVEFSINYIKCMMKKLLSVERPLKKHNSILRTSREKPMEGVLIAYMPTIYRV